MFTFSVPFFVVVLCWYESGKASNEDISFVSETSFCSTFLFPFLGGISRDRMWGGGVIGVLLGESSCKCNFFVILSSLS